jgi:hypothetical protein
MIVFSWNPARSGNGRRMIHVFILTALLVFSGTTSALAAVSWDAGGNSQWWFNPTNWSNDVLPPNSATGTVTDTQINMGTGAWDLGEGIVFDPTNDPSFAAAGGLTFPAGYGPQIINHLYMSRNTTNTNLLTIKGDLTFKERVHVGRSSGVRGTATNSKIVQESGFVQMTLRELDLAQVDTSNPGYGNGTYDYRGGSLEVSQSGGGGLRLSVGSNSLSSDSLKAGPAGIGKFITHNPSTGGYVRPYTLVSAQFAGYQEGTASDGSDSVFDPAYDADGENTGVAIWEFHYENGGTRPIQVSTNMSLNNGVDQTSRGIRSSRLALVLDAAPCTGSGCIPNNIGLFDVDFANSGGLLLGSGDLNGDGSYTNDRVFSNIDNSDDYREGDTVSAIFGGVRYDWTISYQGDIQWTDTANSVTSSITGSVGGKDIVLVGLGSQSVGLPGDFDGDSDVDGQDFLVWQRNPSVGSLSTWQGAYPAPLSATIAAVPEPTAAVLLCLAGAALGMRRW